MKKQIIEAAVKKFGGISNYSNKYHNRQVWRWIRSLEKFTEKTNSILELIELKLIIVELKNEKNENITNHKTV